ncbi:MAG: prolipoprotein diacylglyceryl transferase [Lachnospiraceae bacterium]|nr:prolipoprotein diacylglyceryl transferase [Lachnospiraceae bacterium]
MLPAINIGGFELPLYGLVSIIGFVAAIAVACHLSPKSGWPRVDILFASFYGIIGLVIGAKLLYFIAYLPNIIKYWDLFRGRPFTILMYGFSGFVFYGGLIGFALGVWIYTKQFRIRFAPIMNVVAPAIPLMHAFGRIGCFLGGCCYGIEYHGPFAIHFPENSEVKSLGDFPRFPTQLVESLFNFILFATLFTYIKKGKPKEGQVLGIYLIAYPIERFLIEFLRGDAIRGKFLFLSTSQWISLLLLPIGIYLTFIHHKKELKNNI